MGETWFPPRDYPCMVRKALKLGFRLPVTVRRPDCQPDRAGLVAHQEPEEQVDPRVEARIAVRLAQVLRLLRQRDAEEPVGRVRLVAVLGDPDPLVSVEPRQLSDQDVEVAERDRGRRCAALGRRRGGVRGVSLLHPVVRVVRVGVEARRAPALHPAQERQRRDRGAERARLVVAARRRRAAADLAGERHRLDAPDDRVADRRVVPRALHLPAACPAARTAA